MYSSVGVKFFIFVVCILQEYKIHKKGIYSQASLHDTEHTGEFNRYVSKRRTYITFFVRGTSRNVPFLVERGVTTFTKQLKNKRTFIMCVLLYLYTSCRVSCTCKKCCGVRSVCFCLFYA